jgi:hypothetical protein
VCLKSAVDCTIFSNFIFYFQSHKNSKHTQPQNIHIHNLFFSWSTCSLTLVVTSDFALASLWLLFWRSPKCFVSSVGTEVNHCIYTFFNSEFFSPKTAPATERTPPSPTKTIRRWARVGVLFEFVAVATLQIRITWAQYGLANKQKSLLLRNVQTAGGDAKAEIQVSDFWTCKNGFDQKNQSFSMWKISWKHFGIVKINCFLQK